MVRLCLQKDPRRRPTVEMLLEHAFVAEEAGCGRDAFAKGLGEFLDDRELRRTGR
jgi:hypothetical protein